MKKRDLFALFALNRLSSFIHLFNAQFNRNYVTFCTRFLRVNDRKISFSLSHEVQPYIYMDRESRAMACNSCFAAGSASSFSSEEKAREV